jgi:hypothetical protein
MGRIWTEAGAIRAIRRQGFLNCFASPQDRYFVVSSIPLSKNGTRLHYSVGCALMLKRKLELVSGDSFCAAYRLKAAVHVRAPSAGRSAGRSDVRTSRALVHNFI